MGSAQTPFIMMLGKVMKEEQYEASYLYDQRKWLSCGTIKWLWVWFYDHMADIMLSNHIRTNSDAMKERSNVHCYCTPAAATQHVEKGEELLIIGVSMESIGER